MECSVLCLISAGAGIHQKHRWESSSLIFFLPFLPFSFFFLFFFFISLWLLSLNTLTQELCVLVQSQRRWLSYYEAMRPYFVTARSTAASVTGVTCMPTQWSVLDFPLLTHFQMTGIKREQVSGWRDLQ